VSIPIGEYNCQSRILGDVWPVAFAVLLALDFVFTPKISTTFPRGFNLYGGCKPISEMLLGPRHSMKPIGWIAQKYRNRCGHSTRTVSVSDDL